MTTFGPRACPPAAHPPSPAADKAAPSARPSLRDYQQALVERTRDASHTKGTGPTHLALAAGGTRWLVEAGRGAQVIPAAQVTPVPLTQPWFIGLLRQRQSLVAVIDIGGLLGAPVAPLAEGELLLRVTAEPELALRASRIHGLVDASRWVPLPEEPLPARWIASARVDGDGQRWQELDIGALCADPRFLQVGLACGES